MNLTQPEYKGKITPEEIYYYSPTGELYYVFELYGWAENNDPRGN